MIDRRWHSSILDVRSFRGDDCDTDHYLVAAKFRKGSKQASQKFNVERFNLRKLYDLEFRKQYQIEISNRFVALKNLSDNENILRAWENVRDNIKTSAKESLGLHDLQQHKPWFDEECLRSLDKRKQAKMHWLQDLSQGSVDNLNNVRREASRHFRGKKRRHIRKLNLRNLELIVS